MVKSTIWIGPLLLCSFVAAGQEAPPPAPAPAKPPAAAPAPVQQAEEREGIEDMFSLGVFFWMPDHGRPGFRAGQFVADPLTSRFDLTEKPFRANGAMLTFPTGGFNRLEISYWRVNDSGDLRAPNRLALFGANIANNELMNTQYKLTNLRVAWNYLTFPVPPFGAKFRVKSFWEVQYTQMSPTLYFPEARNNPPPINPKQHVFYPGFGLGVEYIAARAFRLEARGSGMAFPGRSGYYDLEGTAVARIRKLEVYGGLKTYHFHTSRKKDETFIQGTLWGPVMGVRWVFR